MADNTESAAERMLVQIIDNDEKEVLWEPESSHVWGVPTEMLSRRGALRKIQGLQVLINKLEAEQTEAIAAFSRSAESARGVPSELALGLAIGKNKAAEQIVLAEALTTRLPETFKAMRRGEIDSYKAGRIVEPTYILSDEDAREVDRIMAARIGRKDPRGLRTSTNLAVSRVDPEGHAKRAEAKRADRKVELIPQEDGMVELSSRLPAEIGVAAYIRIDNEAKRRRKTDQSKTLDQHRADVLGDLLLRNEYGVKVGPKAEVFLYLDIYTYLNMNTKPAEMAGQGYIPAWLANEIANGPNTTLRRLITDPEDGQIISAGRNTYRPPAALARLAQVRDRECRTPVCHRPSQYCELDHVEDWWAKSGETAEDNLAAFCTGDHHLKDEPGWAYDMDKDTGRVTITTPTGDQYTSDPEPLHEPRSNPLPDDDPPPF